MILLRDLVIGTKLLTEDFKWKHPCYTYEGNNVVLIHGFKDYCALLFHKGALLKDADGILIQQTENVQSARQIRFTDLESIIDQSAMVKAYIREAVEIEKSGIKVVLKQTADYAIPEEFQTQLDSDLVLKNAFSALTPGRQRAYLFYFSQAKQSKTRQARIEKYIPKILDAKGLDD